MSNLYLEMMREKYPNFKDCTIVLLDDAKKWRDLVRKVNQAEYSNDVLEKALDVYNKKWAGIYFSVNSMVPWERDIQSVTHINARICEIDDLTKEEQLNLISVAPLAPSLIIESKKGYHMYWFAKDWTKENWNKICWGLRNFFCGDPQIIEISRVLRIPWYYHMKDENDPFECTITDWCWEYYTEEQMLKAFPDTESASEKKQKAIKKEVQLRQAVWNDDTRDRIRAMDCKAMLERLSWTSLVWWDIISFRPHSDGTEQIRCNWKSTGCWLDKQWKIWSKDWWWPNWTNWIAWYGWVDWKDIYKWIKEEFPSVIPNKKSNTSDWEISEEEIEKWTQLSTTKEKKGFLYPSDKFNEFEWFMSGDLVTIVAPSNSWKTTLALDIIKRNAKIWRKWMYINLEFEIATVPRGRRMRAHWKNKMDLTDLWTMTCAEKEDMEAYIKSYLSEFDYYNNPNGLSLDKLISLIRKKVDEWYELFVIDTFSKIDGNLNSDTARTNQNKCMEAFQSLVQELNIAVVMLHHTNRQWTREGSQKILDLSNVFITIEKSDDGTGMPSRIYRLMKDKYTPDKEIELRYDIKTWDYLSSLTEVLQAKKWF